MASNEYMTPGSAVADIVQQILQRRKDEQRQLMLDRLGIAKYQSEEDQRGKDYALRQTAEARQGRESEANIQQSNASTANLNDERENRDIAGLGYGPRAIDGMDPELVNELIKRGMVQEAPQQPVGGVGQPGGPGDPLSVADQTLKLPGEPSTPHRMYMGSSKYQEDQANRQRITDFITQHPETFKDNPDLANAVMMQAAGIAVNQLPDSLTGASPSVTELGPNFRGTKDLPRGGTAAIAPYAPQVNAANAAQLYSTYDDAGKVTGSYWLKPGDQPGDTNRINTPLYRQGTGGPKQPTKPTDIIPQQLLDSYRKARQNSVGPAATRQAGVSQAHADILAAAAQHGVSQQTLDDVTSAEARIQKDQAAGKPIPTVADIINANPNLTETERLHLGIVLRAVLGEVQ